MESRKLFLVHCGFYDTDLLDGIYESHVNFFVAATDFDEARSRAKLHPDFQRKRMHVDGLQEIQAVEGYRVELAHAPELEGKNLILGNRHRELAPKKPATQG